MGHHAAWLSAAAQRGASSVWRLHQGLPPVWQQRLPEHGRPAPRLVLTLAPVRRAGMASMTLASLASDTSFLTSQSDEAKVKLRLCHGGQFLQVCSGSEALA